MTWQGDTRQLLTASGKLDYFHTNCTTWARSRRTSCNTRTCEDLKVNATTKCGNQVCPIVHGNLVHYDCDLVFVSLPLHDIQLRLWDKQTCISNLCSRYPTIPLPYPMLGMGRDPLNRLRTRPSIPLGFLQLEFAIRLKRSLWCRANFLVRFLTDFIVSRGFTPPMFATSADVLLLDGYFSPREQGSVCLAIKLPPQTVWLCK